MRRSDSVWRLGRTGTTGVLAAALAVSAAEAALPTGGMLLPRPRGPARADLPAHTAIDVFRVPSATAYGLSGPGETSFAETISDESSFAEESAAPSEATNVNVEEAPLIQPRIAADDSNPFRLPEPAAEAAQTGTDPFADLDAAAAHQEQGFADEAPVAEAVPPDSWEADAAPVEASDAIYAGLKGICPVTLREERRVAAPSAEFFSEFEGRRYEFATAEAKAAFDADPKAYAPVLGGRDVVLTAAGAADAIGSLEHAGVYRERLYLFQSDETCKRFYENPRRFLVNE